MASLYLKTIVKRLGDKDLVSLIIRNSILSHMEILKNESKLILWMKISKDLLLLNEDV